MSQYYVYNKNAAVYNCNVCDDMKIIMIGSGEQPPKGCTNPMCESNQRKVPTPGLKVEYVEYGDSENIERIDNWMNLKVGEKIRIGPGYARENNRKPGEILTLVEGTFHGGNEKEIAPSVWNKEYERYDSIFHLFGNDLEDFMDCKII